MKLLALLLALILLTGCGRTAELPTEPQPPEPAENRQELPEVSEPEAPPLQTPATRELSGIYLYTDGPRSLIVDGSGQVLFETREGEAAIIYRDGTAVGFAVAMQDGRVIDEWGWASPARSWCDVYDLRGQYRYTVPLSYVSLIGELLMGYNRETGTSQLYRWSDGTLLYDDVYVAEQVGDRYYIALGSWESQGFFMDESGQKLFDLPEGYLNGSRIQKQYLVVSDGTYSGLLDSQGQFVLPCEYEQIRSGQLGCIFARQDGMWYALDPVTGKTVFQWPHLIQQLLPDGAIVQTDEEANSYQLVDRNGTLLLEQAFTWPDSIDELHDGLPELFTASTTDYEGTLCFRPDGTLLMELESGGYLLPLDQDRVLLHRYEYETDPENPTSEWTLIDLGAKEQTFLTDDPSVYCSQIYSINGPLLGLFLKEGPNAQGWYRTSVLDCHGNVLLEDLQDVYYRDEGVFQCRKGFTSGLITTDGNWLYQESSFSAVEDDN